MGSLDTDRVFGGSVPELYDTYLVPLIFESYALDLAKRASEKPVGNVLEIAAGTGVVTRALASALPASVSIVATDLNQGMIDRAAAVGTERPVEWRLADAMQLPFETETFDEVICQFGVMFFPDRPKAFTEVRRVLRPGGVFMFNAWDRIAENEFADTVTTSLESLFPDDPPRFLERTPHGYHDIRTIERDIASCGFASAPLVETITKRSEATSSRIPAIAYCQGTPLRDEIKARNPSLLEEATDIAAEAIARRFGRGHISGKIQAHVVTVEV